jgi:hypothetical protein
MQWQGIMIGSRLRASSSPAARGLGLADFARNPRITAGSLQGIRAINLNTSWVKGGGALML